MVLNLFTEFLLLNLAGFAVGLAIAWAIWGRRK